MAAIMVVLRLEANSPRLLIATDSLSSMFLIRKMLLHPHRIAAHKHSCLLEEICTSFRARISAGFTTDIRKVRAHTNIQGNERAEAAAKVASSGATQDSNGNDIPEYTIPDTYRTAFPIKNRPPAGPAKKRLGESK